MIHPKSAFLCISPSLFWINASSLFYKAINLWLYGVKFLPTPSLGLNIVLRRQHWVIPLSRFKLWTGEGARSCWLPQKRSEFKEKHLCPSSAQARGKHHYWKVWQQDLLRGQPHCNQCQGTRWHWAELGPLRGKLPAASPPRGDVGINIGHVEIPPDNTVSQWTLGLHMKGSWFLNVILTEKRE